MVDYKKRYYILCQAASAALDVLPESPDTEKARQILSTALNEAEDKYIETDDET